jgi:DNA-binding transcriptional MerR regulator
MTPWDPKSLLASADSPAERKHAVIQAMSAGMPLHEIEEFLDWTDAVRAGRVTEPIRHDRARFYHLIRQMPK